MNFGALLFHLTRECGDWRAGPAPKAGPYMVRTNGALHCTLHFDNWLLKEIHGANYEWAPLF